VPAASPPPTAALPLLESPTILPLSLGGVLGLGAGLGVAAGVVGFLTAGVAPPSLSPALMVGPEVSSGLLIGFGLGSCA